jgi:SAM-dependent methyltransferase
MNREPTRVTMSEPTGSEKTGKTWTKATWADGDVLSGYAGHGDEECLRRIGVHAQERLLEIGCGSGGFAVMAARAGAAVTGIDADGGLVAQARARARHEAVNVRFDQGDSAALPYASGSFETVVSRFGIIFEPHPGKTAAELSRVCWPGGRIVLDVLIATGFTGRLAKLIASHVPPPDGAIDPLRWGEEGFVRELLDDFARPIATARHPHVIEFPFGPIETANLHFQQFGPLRSALASLSEPVRKEALKRDVEELFLGENRAGNSATRIESEFMEVIAKRF